MGLLTPNNRGVTRLLLLLIPIGFLGGYYLGRSGIAPDGDMGLLVSVPVLHKRMDDDDDSSNSLDENSNSHSRPDRTLFPRRHITVVGLESSGTVFVTRLLAAALNITAGESYPAPPPKRKARGKPWQQQPASFSSPASEYQVLHHSLPEGCYCTSTQPPSTVIPFFPPTSCVGASTHVRGLLPHCVQVLEPDNGGALPTHCGRVAGIHAAAPIPTRFFVNITNHVRWYQSRNVDATAVIVVRDSSISFRSRREHCLDATIRKREEELGMRIITEALNELGGESLMRMLPANSGGPRVGESVVVVSYETMMRLGWPYVRMLYRSLGINSTYMPAMKDGNIKHVK